MISAIIPTYRGAARLAQNLPPLLASLENYGPAEVIVVDDGGRIDQAPNDVRLVVLGENYGYGPAVNAGVRSARGDYLLILNDDVTVQHDTVARLASRFPDDGLFAVSPAVRSSRARHGDEAAIIGRWVAGMLDMIEAPSPASHPVLYPLGCCFLCPRRAFVDLGGYDERFVPFFWEDIDLGYRAWRRGWRILHIPEAVCEHEGSATILERPLGDRERAWARNRVLFHLLNIRDPIRRAQNAGAWAAYCLFDERKARQQGLRDALASFETSRPAEPHDVSDADILATVAEGSELKVSPDSAP